MFVTINDDSCPKEASFESGSTAPHMFVLEATTQGRFQNPPIVIKYFAPTKAAI